MTDIAIIAILGVLVVNLTMLFIRGLLGPTSLDRLVMLESTVLVLVAFLAFWGLVLGTNWFWDVIVVFSLVGFLSAVALAKFIEQGTIGDDD